MWAAFSSTLGFAEFAATVFDHYHPSESFEPAERLGLQASACMSSELLAELRELRSELAQLSNRVLLLESQVTKTPNLRLSLRFSPWTAATRSGLSAACARTSRAAAGTATQSFEPLNL